LVVLFALTGTGLVALASECLTGDASEKGKEAAVTRRLLERVRKIDRDDAIKGLVADGLYADGPRSCSLWSALESGQTPGRPTKPIGHVGGSRTAGSMS